MSQLLFGYNTNGFAHHRLDQALEIVADLGYQSVAITLDHHCLNPFEGDLAGQVRAIRPLLHRFHGNGVIETGARFLLDSRRKHQPTLISANRGDRQRRLDFLSRAIDAAAETGFNLVSFWSGAADKKRTARSLMNQLADGCKWLANYADVRNVRLAFEPEPGMFVDTMAKFEELSDRVNHPRFGLTIDIGHLHCQGETPIVWYLRRWKDLLWNIHIEDMKRGVHEHLMPGEGEIRFGPILRTLADIGYAGGVQVELSRHSHDAVETARKALAFLRNASR